MLGRKLNSDYYIHLLCQIYESQLKDLSIQDYFFDISAELTEDGKKFYDVIKKVSLERTLDLKKDIVLSWRGIEKGCMIVFQ
ncbi:hypothetical protein FDC35_06865 [Clostridium botulinum]|nr:hypothetical protein [Clostridium botulinum]NFP00621.1 hypothetical protein [Clostridium botulinum]